MTYKIHAVIPSAVRSARFLQRASRQEGPCGSALHHKCAEVERLIGSHHHKTTISDGKDRVEALGRTTKEAEDRASKKWEDRKKK
jgi:hypothetical protein